MVKPTSYRLVEFTTLVKFTKNTFFFFKEFFISDDQKQFFYFLMLHADVSCLNFFQKSRYGRGPCKAEFRALLFRKVNFRGVWKLKSWNSFFRIFNAFINWKEFLVMFSTFWMNGINKLTKVNYVWFLFHKFTKWNICPTASIRLFLSNLDRKFYSKHEFCVLFSFVWISCTKIHKNEF